MTQSIETPPAEAPEATRDDLGLTAEERASLTDATFGTRSSSVGQRIELGDRQVPCGDGDPTPTE